MIISGGDPVEPGGQRLEVCTAVGKGRERPPGVKVSLVAECYSGRESARQHGLGPSQVYEWRRDLRTLFKAAGLSASPTESEVPSLVPPSPHRA